MSLWTAQQHEWLQALGHPVLLLAGDPALTAIAPAPADTVRPARQPEAATAANPGRTEAHAHRPRTDSRPTSTGNRTPPAASLRTPPENSVAAPQHTAVDARQAADAPRADAAAKKAALEAARGARRAARPAAASLPADDPLLQAIVRASGLDTGAFEAAARTWQIDLARLRAEPSAKRELWQRMRSPRRNRRR